MRTIDFEAVREDLKFPVFKLYERMMWERLVAQSGLESASTGRGVEEVSDADSARIREEARQRATECEAAINILLCAAPA